MTDKEIQVNKLIKKLSLYIGGLLILALGINLSLVAELGVSPISTIPYVSELIWGIEFSKATSLVYVILIVLQIILLREIYKPIQLLQIVLTYLFGFFLTYTSSEYLLSWLPIPNTYILKLIYLFISIILIGVGASLYLIPNYIPLPAEGFANAITEIGKGKIKFANVKIAVDVSFIIISIILSVAFLGEVNFLREGTVIAALLGGKVIGFVNKYFKQGILEWIEQDEKDTKDKKGAYNYS